MQTKEQIPSTKNLSNYDILGLLGRGSNSFVYKARNTQTRKIVVLKVIDISSSQTLYRARREVAIHKQLHHPHIVQYIEDFRDETNWYLVLDYCQRGELFTYLKNTKGGLPEKEVKRLGLQLLSALAYLKQRKVVHLDLKLGNIFLDRNNDVCIGDFGLSEKLADNRCYPLKEKKSGSGSSEQNNKEKKKGRFRSQSVLSEPNLFGTPNYIPPELIKGDQKGPENDVWSLGVVFFALRAGRCPFEGKSAKKTLRNVLKQRLVFPANFSEKLITLLEGMLVQKEKRKSAEELLEGSFFGGKKNGETTLSTIDVDKGTFEKKRHNRVNYLKEVKKETINHIVRKRALQRNKSLGMVCFGQAVYNSKGLKSKRQLKEVFKRQRGFGVEGLKAKINFGKLRGERKNKN